MTEGKRIVLATWGSFGDIHPYLAVARGLNARGHKVVVTAPETYRAKIEKTGIAFLPVRPELPDLRDHTAAGEMARRIMESRDGSRHLVQDRIVPALREMYDDLWTATEDADLLVAHSVLFACPLVAAKRKMPWLSVALQPILFLSAYDPPVPPDAPDVIQHRHRIPRPVLKALMAAGKWKIRPWVAPVDAFRAELGLPPGGHPLFDGQWSPYGTLALFSPLLGVPQPDWPRGTVQTGFPFYDRLDEAEPDLSPELVDFLDAGEPPVVFTLGTSAVMTAGGFYEESAEAARRLGRRAILLVGAFPGNRPKSLSDGVAAFDYAPYSALFPRAAAVVHQGGVGTTGQAMRSGRPQVVVPFAHDQPDNADRMVRLGVARTVRRDRYTAATVADELRLLLDTPSYTEKALAVGRSVQAEDGVGAACDAIGATLRRVQSPG